MGRSNLPRYVERADNQSMATPAALDNVEVFFFPLASDVARQQALCDKFLNAPSRGLAHYRAFFPQAFLFFNRTGAVQSLAPAAHGQGFFPYMEAGIWLATMAIDETGVLPVATRFVFFPYYMWTSSSHAMVSGREEQGWPKEIARMTTPEDPSNANLFELRPVLFDRFGPRSHAQEEQLLRITKVAGTSCGGLAQVWTEGSAAVESIVELIFGGSKITVPGLELVVSLAEIILRGPSFAFLKQFRDAADPSRACYQAGVEAGTRITRFRRAGLLSGKYNLSVKDCESHPLVHELGLEPRTFSDLRGFFIDMNFSLESGVARWRAP